jgi:hypothetical protein
MRAYSATDMTDLWHMTTRQHLYETVVDLYLGIGTNLNDVILVADSMEFEFDFREVWLNRQRWTRLVHEYLDPDETSDFVRRARVIFDKKGKNGVITNMAFRGVERTARKHKWGNCLMAATFRGTPGSDVQPTLTLHSRVSYNAYMLGLDFCMAHILAREIVGEGNLDQVKLNWHLDVVQFHSFKSLPYIYTQHDLMNDLVKLGSPRSKRALELKRQYPTWKSIARWYEKVLEFEEEGKTLAEEKYGPFKRIRRRYQEYQRGELVPSVTVDTLDLSKLEGYNP